MKKSKSFVLKQGIIYILFVVMSLTIIYPLFWILSNSLKTNKEFYSDTFSLPSILNFSNYREAWENGISTYYINSLLVTAAAVILILILSTLAAFALTRLDMKFKKIIFILLIGGMFVSPQTAVLPLYDILQNIHLYDTYAAMILPDTAFRLSFSIFLLYPGFASIPGELEEAALIDGATRFKIYRKVVLPVCKPTVMACILLNLIYVWDEFTFALNFISNEKYYTIPVGLMSFSQALYTDWVVLLAGITLAVIPILIVFIVFQKYFIAGLTVGSVKE